MAAHESPRVYVAESVAGQQTDPPSRVSFASLRLVCTGPLPCIRV